MSAEDKRYCVYCHTSPNGKRYVGITGRKPEERWRNGQGYHGAAFYNAVKKYGWDNIAHEIIENGLTREEAIDREIYYVALYKSNQNKFGYNSTAGGEGTNGTHVSDEMKKNLSEKCRGFKHTPEAVEKIRKKAKENWTRPEYRQRMSETHSGENHHMFGKKADPVHMERLHAATRGKKHTDEWKLKVSEKLRGEGNPNYGRKFGPEFCEIQKQQATALMADPARRQHLRDSFERKRVEQHALDGTLLATYDGIHEAARQTGCPASNISLCCRKQRKTVSGFIWNFA